MEEARSPPPAPVGCSRNSASGPLPDGLLAGVTQDTAAAVGSWGFECLADVAALDDQDWADLRAACDPPDFDALDSLRTRRTVVTKAANCSKLSEPSMIAKNSFVT